MARPRKYSEELRRRAIDEVVERGRRIPDVARDLGIKSPETLRAWVRQAEIDRGLKAGPSTGAARRDPPAAPGGGRPAAHHRDPQGGDNVFRPGGRPATAVMVAFVDDHRSRWPVAAMCSAIELSERGYYAPRARPRCAPSVSDGIHAVEIRRVLENNYRCYGARRIYKQLRREGYVVARCTVARLMADMGLRGVQRDQKRFTTTPDANATRPPDLVDRRFMADRHPRAPSCQADPRLMRSHEPLAGFADQCAS
jgi:hypothetical protein